MKKLSQEEITDKLHQDHFTQGPGLERLSDPVIDTPMLVTLEQLRPYEHNPRFIRNPVYDDIKASIRERGLDQPPPITRRPGEASFIIRNGGNTRLAILGELWQETRDERFFRIHCLFRPWSNEITALLGHLAESDLHGQLTFIERALAVAKLKTMLESDGADLSQRELARRLAAGLARGEERLTAVGKLILVQGWKSLLSENTEEDEPSHKSQVLPILQKGAQCAVDNAELKSMQTAAPKPLTEGDLIKAMKNVAKLVNDPRLKQKLRDTTGIGTEATRAGIIKGLIDRGYLLKKKRALMATAAAHTLIEAVPAAVADPGMTAIWEQALDEIEAGRLTLDAFVAKQANWIAQLVEHCGALTLAVPVEAGPTCPICNASMRRRKGKSGPFWSCSHYPDCRGTVPIRKDTQHP